jgi:hypothetical protein
LPIKAFFRNEMGSGMKRSILAILLSVLSLGAAAEDYPVRPITMLVPFAAGGPSDTIARLVADGMRGSLGQPVVIENAVGAGGTIAVGRVVRAAPDGYTIGIGNWGTHVANGVLYALPYDLVNDLEPVSLLPSEALLIAAKKAVPADNLAQLIAWLKENPGKASAGTSGVGGPSHMATLLFQKQSGTQFQLVPYRGAGPAFQDLLAGQIDLMMAGLSLGVPKVRRSHQGLRSDGTRARDLRARHPDHRRGGAAGIPRFRVARSVDHEGRPDGYDQEAHHRGAGRACRFHRAPAAWRPCDGDSNRRPANAARSRHPSEGRDREVVAHHEGRERQGSVSGRPQAECPPRWN